CIPGGGGSLPEGTFRRGGAELRAGGRLRQHVRHRTGPAVRQLRLARGPEQRTDAGSRGTGNRTGTPTFAPLPVHHAGVGCPEPSLGGRTRVVEGRGAQISGRPGRLVPP